MKKKIRKLLPKKGKQKDVDNDESNNSRITNDTVAEHREKVLSGGRKYIYPLQHSKHRIVVITTGIVIAALVIFMTYSLVALYRLGSTSSFLYRVTQVVPFPVAKAGPRYVAYENYLFELRHYMHFYENQQKLDFGSEAGQQQLEDYKRRALDKVINDAYVKILAKENNISVSDQEVQDQITILRRQNRLGGSEQAYNDALKQNFGWSPEDFQRVVKQQLLEQKVMSTLDTQAHADADKALTELQAGRTFAEVAEQFADDSGRVTVGVYESVDPSSRDLSPITTDALFKLDKGQLSGVINTGYSLQILKNLEVRGDGKIKAEYIEFNFQPVETYVNDLKEREKAQQYITP